MVTITLDQVIRKTLAKSRLPQHYYVKYLLFATDILKEMQYAMLPSYKTVSLTLDANKEALLPSDFVSEVGAYNPVGDKMLELPHNDTISTLDNYGAGFGAAQPNVYLDGSSLIGYTSRPSNYFDMFGEATGRLFGGVQVVADGFRIVNTILGTRIRFDTNTTITTVVLRYITLPVKVSNQSVIHPFIEAAIVAGVMWQRALYWKEADVMMKRAEFFNERRIAKAKFNPLNITDLKNLFRKYSNSTIKT